MSATWLIGDLHLGHAKVAELRGYRDVETHDAKVKRAWFGTVQEGDVVYVLGDISSGTREGELRALAEISFWPGRKRLISGNHDSVASVHRRVSPNINAFRMAFETIGDFGRIRLENRNVLLSHYPYEGDHEGIEPRYRQFRLRDFGEPLIHAHTHSSERFNGNQACVSWEAWGEPVNVGWLADWAKGLPDG